MITPMTPEPPDAPVSTVLPDLRAVRLDQMPLSPATLEQVVRRVLPGRPVQTVTLGTSFGSSV